MNDKVLTLGYPSTLGTGSRSGYPFNQIFSEVREVTPRDVFNKIVDAVVIWGGGDISPSLYGKPISKRTSAQTKLGYRDEIERDIVDAAFHSGIPVIGVCRGAQLVCAMSGGVLVQDVNGHHSNHAIRLKSGRSINTTSIHHQMMFPFDLDQKDYDILAWSENKLSARYVMTDTDIREDIPLEPEIIYFKNTNSLAIQGHPEFADVNTDFVQESLALVSKLLNGELNHD